MNPSSVHKLFRRDTPHADSALPGVELTIPPLSAAVKIVFWGRFTPDPHQEIVLISSLGQQSSTFRYRLS